MAGVDLRSRLMGRSKPAENQKPDDPRAVLAQAIERAAEAARMAAEAGAAAERGLAATRAAEAALRPFDGLDAAVAAHHANVARAGEPPGRGLPADLVERRRARAAALEDLADARAAHELLVGEADAAAREAEAARLVVKRAVAAVCAAEGRSIVEGIRSLERQAADLRNALTGFGSDWTPLDPVLPVEITSVLHEAQHPLLLDVHGYTWKSPCRLDWPAFRAALAADAQARLEVPSDPGSGR